jgi:O-antigen/teichoic acid export membrane protein
MAQTCYFIVLARLLGVYEYGIYAGATALISIASRYSTLGSGFLFLRYVSSDSGKFAAYWGNILLSTGMVSGLLVFGIHLLGGRLAGREAAPLLVFVAIGDCLCSQLVNCCGQVFQSFERLSVTAAITAATNVIRLATVLGLSIICLHVGAREWAICQMCVSGISALIAACLVIRFYGMPGWSPGLIRSHGLEGLSFAVSGSTTSIYNDLDKTMLGHYGMNADNGAYTMAYRVVDIAMAPVSAIHAAAFPRFCRLGSNGAQATLPYAVKILKKTIIFGVASALILYFTAPLLPLVVGRGYATSVTVLLWLCPLPVLRCFHLSAGDAITGAGHQPYRLASQFVASVVNFSVNLWLIPAYGWHGAAYSSLATDGLLALMNAGILGALFLREGGTLSTLADCVANV